MLRHRRQARTQKVPQPPDTDTNDAAEAVQSDVFAQYSFHHGTLFFFNPSVCGVPDKWAAPVFALLLLLSVGNMAIFRQHLGVTLKTRVSHAHGYSPPPALEG